VLQLRERDVRRIKVLRIRPQAHDRTVRRASFDFSDLSFCFSSPPSNAIVCFCPSR
jgi:hypothetical protein